MSIIKNKDVNTLLIVPEKGSGEGPYTLITEDGQVLANHFCSNSSFAKGDLHDNRADRREKYAEAFGEYEVKFVDETDITPEELYERNEAHAVRHGYRDKNEEEE